MPTLRMPRGARAGLVSAAAAAAGLLAGCSETAPTPTEPPASSTPAPSESAAAPELAVRGVLDVPSLPADAIPWDEVGLGWFLLSFDRDHGPSATDPGFYDRARFAPTEEEIYLFSPDASVYFVRSLKGLGNVRAQLWVGSVLALEESTWEPETDVVPSGPLTGLDLRSGASTRLADLWGNDWIEGVLSNGNLVTVSSDDGGAQRHVRSRDLSDLGELCGVGSGQSGASNISPDGSRAFCLVERSDGRSDVILYDLATGTSTAIDVFKYPASDYQTAGWTGASSVVITRWDNASGSDRYWAYNVDTLKLSDYVYVYRSGRVSGFGANAHRVVLDGDSATVQSVDGTLTATISSCGRLRGSWSSDASAMVTCSETDSAVTTLYALDLSTGKVTNVATFDPNEGALISVFPGLAG